MVKGLSNIISKLYLVIAFCFFIIGWLISFISLIVSEAEKYNFYRLTWFWWLAFNSLICAGLIFFITFSEIREYRLLLVVYLATCINWSIGAIDSLFQAELTKLNAIGVGHLLLTVAFLIWILYFGCESNTTLGRWLNSNGFNSKPGQGAINRQYAEAPVASSENELPLAEVVRAQAICDYTANEEDPQEISFSKGEVLEITNTKGTWWRARKADGTTGAVPSNFFEIIQ